MIQEKCKEVNENLVLGKVDAAYRAIKRNFQEDKPKSKNIRDKGGHIILNENEQANRWKEHLEELYGEEKTMNPIEEEESVDENELGDPILRSEFETALKELKNNRAPGIDNIQAEILKNSGEKARDKLFELISKIYKLGIIPKDFEKNKIVTLPKKTGADKCENFRTISLTSHASKILTKIIQRRIEQRVEENLGEDQFGFRRNRGTREAILSLRLIIERAFIREESVYIGFIDLEKAFDNVNWEIMFKILKQAGIKFRERRLIYNLYQNQTAIINIGDEQREAKIKKGVRQGCVLSPMIFNLYIEEAIKEFKDKIDTGIEIQGQKIAMLRFADDIALLGSNKKELEDALNGINQILIEEIKMKINKNKTKVLVCTKKEQTRQECIKINQENLEGVKEFRYLGSKITWDGRSENEIKSRIAQAKMGFNSKQKLLCSSSISLANRKLLLKTYVWSIAMYGCETWTIREAERKRLEAFEMWCYRRMMNIKWMDKITNEEVLGRIGERRTLWKSLKKRRGQMMGHTLRHGGLLRDILEGEVGKKRGRGRPRLEYFNQIIGDMGCQTFREVKQLAGDRVEWRRIVASNQS